MEKLNTATDNINKYEVELDVSGIDWHKHLGAPFFFLFLQEAKSDFKQLLVESVEKIKQSAHKLSNSIQSAKPYYEARLYAAQVNIMS